MADFLDIPSVPAPIKKPADPFAGDLFAAAAPAAAAVNDVASGSPNPSSPEVHQAVPRWSDKLPKVSRDALEQSELLETIPEGLTQRIINVVSQSMQASVFPQQSRVECAMNTARECDLVSATAGFRSGEQVAIHLVAGVERAPAIVLLGNDAVKDLIDQIFGSSGYRPSGRLSPVEGAVIEFLTAKIVTNINRELDGGRISVSGISSAPADLFGEHARGVGVTLNVHADEFRHGAQLLISLEFLAEVIEASGVDRSTERRRALPRIAPEVELRARLGATRLDAASIAALETGDIVIVEEPSFDWNAGAPVGSLTLFAGAGSGFAIAGTIQSDPRSGMSLQVNEIVSRRPVDVSARNIFMDKKQMESELGSDELDNELVASAGQASGELSPAVENIQVRLRVELSGNKMTLRELSDLRAGQILDLGRQATDSVTLITDGAEEAIGVGELVDIDGRLGVRLTKVFVS